VNGKFALLVGELDQDICVAGHIERAVARKVATSELAPNVVDVDGQPTSE
jgi:hypothetical protein